jgi:hypothetical protein
MAVLAPGHSRQRGEARRGKQGSRAEAAAVHTGFVRCKILHDLSEKGERYPPACEPTRGCERLFRARCAGTAAPTTSHASHQTPRLQGTGRRCHPPECSGRGTCPQGPGRGSALRHAGQTRIHAASSKRTATLLVIDVGALLIPLRNLVQNVLCHGGEVACIPSTHTPRAMGV